MSRKRSTSPVSRKVWRMSANAPLGEIVSSDPLAEDAKPGSHVEHAEWPEARRVPAGANSQLGARRFVLKRRQD